MTDSRVERKLAAIFAADVVGYSRLMGLDEVGTLTRLTAIRKELVQPTIASHKGRIVKLMGDGLLAEFASAVEAVHCAIDVQKKMREREIDSPNESRIALRIGVNLGDIIVEDRDIYGDGVNVASRLEEHAEPGGISISGAVHNLVSGRLEVAFDDLGELRFKNISEPIRVFRVRDKDENVLALSGERPSIAVLPFAAMSDSREHEFIADGIVEDLITHLARLPGFLVIARNSSFAYKGKSPDIRSVGRELGASYVVEGSIRAMGDRLRVTVQLINSQTGNHLWADYYDRDADKIYQVHDELVAGIVGCIEPALAHAEVEALDHRPPGDVDAWQHYWKAISLIRRRGWHGENFSKAEKLFRKAISIDEEFALAHARLALHLALGHMSGLIPDAREVYTQAEIAINLDPNRSEVLGFAGCAIQDVGTIDRGIDILERAIELNPSNSQAWGALGAGYLMSKRNEEAVEKLEYGVRISPGDSFLQSFYGSLLAIALSRIGKLDEAIDRARAACRIEGGTPNPRITLAALLSTANRTAEASNVISETLRLYPDLSFEDARAMVGGRLGGALKSLWPISNDKS